jgi:hypothetical protein
MIILKSNKVLCLHCHMIRKVSVLEGTVFWNVASCTPLDVYWHFRGTHCLHLQGWKVNKENIANRFSIHASLCLFAGCNLFDLLSNPEDRGRTSLQTTQHRTPEDTDLQSLKCHYILFHFSKHLTLLPPLWINPMLHHVTGHVRYSIIK